jgi:phosphopantetheinyl transferase
VRRTITCNLEVSVAHKDDLAVAIAGNEPVGIDIEKIEARPASFVAVAFTAGELALGSGDEFFTRLWAAKEAVGKLRGTGVTDPKRLEVGAVVQETLTIDDVLVETRREGDYIVAWTTGRRLL